MRGKDGGVGGYALLPCTTKTRITNNLKTKNNQNCQKIELYGSLTTKELKKKGQRWAAGTQRTHGKVVAGGQGGHTFECR